MRNLCLISNKNQFRQSFKEAERLLVLDPRESSPNGKKLYLLVWLLDKYNQENFAKKYSTALAAVKYRMSKQGLKQKDLVKYFGSSGYVSAFLSGKRTLTLKIIRKLNKGLGISASILIQEIKIKNIKR